MKCDKCTEKAAVLKEVMKLMADGVLVRSIEKDDDDFLAFRKNVESMFRLLISIKRCIDEDES